MESHHLCSVALAFKMFYLIGRNLVWEWNATFCFVSLDFYMFNVSGRYVMWLLATFAYNLFQWKAYQISLLVSLWSCNCLCIDIQARPTCTVCSNFVWSWKHKSCVWDICSDDDSGSDDCNKSSCVDDKVSMLQESSNIVVVNHWFSQHTLKDFTTLYVLNW